MKMTLENQKTILIIVVFFLVFSFEVSADKDQIPKHFELLHDRNDIKLLKNTERFYEFLSEDEKYLKNIDDHRLEKEIALFDQYMYEAKTSFRKVNNVILYSPNTVGNVVICEIASKNRQSLLTARRENKKFKYQSNTLHYPRKSVKVSMIDSIDPHILKVAYEEIENVIENLDMPRGFLENTIISLSPFKLKGIKGFTEIYGSENEGITLVLGIDARFINENSEAFKEEVRSVLLHELGHIFHLENTRVYKDDYDLGSQFWQDYGSYYNSKLNFDYREKQTRENWGKDIRENLAEDFRMHYSRKLGKYSFKPKPKQTNSPYNPDIEKFFKLYEDKGISSENVCMRHSTVENVDMKYTLYDYSVREIKNDNGLKIDIQTKKGQACEDAYIGVWKDGKRERSERIPVKNNKDTHIEIDKNSDINTVIKYVRVKNEYKPLWRLNIN